MVARPDTAPKRVLYQPGAPSSADARRPSRSERRAQERAAAPRDYFFVVLVVLALAKAALSRTLGLHTANLFWAGVLEAAAIVAILGIVDVLPRRRSYLLDLTAYTVLSLVMLANVVYISFFDTIFSPTMLSMAGQAGDVTSSITSQLRPVYLLYVIDVLPLLAWAIVKMRKRNARPSRRSTPVMISAGVAAIVLVVQIMVVMSIPTDVDTIAIAKARGFGAYQLASVVRLVVPQPGANVAAAAIAAAHAEHLTPGQAVQRQIEAINKADAGPRIGGVLHGTYKGKNVIIIQVEALDDLVVGKTIDGKTITPNLNQLVGDSWYFPNTFSQAGVGNTVDAEFTVNTSLMSPDNQAASVAYGSRVLPGLPRIMRDNGYDAITMHVNDVRFWDRINLYPALGFRAWWDRSYFKNRDKMWHASDQVLFQYGMKVLQSEEASTAPFYAFMITESSHNPFTAIPMNRRPLRLSAKDESTWAGRYVGSISYTDMAIGQFVQAMKKNGMWDDSIVIIYGDHSALLDTGPKKGDRPIPAQLLGRPFTVADRQRIPLIIHLPGQTRSEVSTQPVGQTDIMPTVADLVGADLSGTPHLGRSVFVGSKSLVPNHGYLPAGTFADDSVLFMPGLGYDDATVLNVGDGSPAEKTDAMRSELSNTRQLDQISQQWLQSLPQRAGARSLKHAILP